MTDTFSQGLIITGIGMGLVFVAIVFLWGLMAFMVHLDSRVGKPDNPVSQPQTESFEQDSLFIRYKAAAAAVAAAMAARKTGTGTSGITYKNQASAWKQVQRAQVLHDKSRVVIHRQDRRS